MLDKKEKEIDRIIKDNNYSFDRIKELYLNEKYIRDVNDDFERAAQLLFSSTYTKH